MRTHVSRFVRAALPPWARIHSACYPDKRALKARTSEAMRVGHTSRRVGAPSPPRLTPRGAHRATPPTPPPPPSSAPHPAAPRTSTAPRPVACESPWNTSVS